jgi:hypothetical protein
LRWNSLPYRRHHSFDRPAEETTYAHITHPRHHTSAAPETANASIERRTRAAATLGAITPVARAQRALGRWRITTTTATTSGPGTAQRSHRHVHFKDDVNLSTA